MGDLPAFWLRRGYDGRWIVGSDSEAMVLPKGGVMYDLLPLSRHLTIALHLS